MHAHMCHMTQVRMHKKISVVFEWMRERGEGTVLVTLRKDRDSRRETTSLLVSVLPPRGIVLSYEKTTASTDPPPRLKHKRYASRVRAILRKDYCRHRPTPSTKGTTAYFPCQHSIILMSNEGQCLSQQRLGRGPGVHCRPRSCTIKAWTRSSSVDGPAIAEEHRNHLSVMIGRSSAGTRTAIVGTF